MQSDSTDEYGRGSRRREPQSTQGRVGRGESSMYYRSMCTCAGERER